MAVGNSCVRYLLFAFTMIFVVFGGLLIYTGFSTFVSLHKYELVVHNGPDHSTIALLVIGCLIFFTAFLGCCGALTGNDCMLRTFAFILTLLLLIELVSVGFVFTFRGKIHQSMQSGFETAVVRYNATDKESPLTVLVDDVQSHFRCCGANSPADWKNNTFYKDSTLPKSCCRADMELNITCSMESENHFREGCVDIISDELKSSVSYLATIAIIVILVQVVGILFSCCLTCQRRQYAYV